MSNKRRKDTYRPFWFYFITSKLTMWCSIPALAEGGVVTGPTLALIGEGRESEAVIPLSKLNTMMEGGGGQNVVVTGRISGSDILLSNERASRNRTRQRGF